ncbi:protein kinase domain-containing protein [Mobilicoccus sp.]|uniref:serine/threonine-protein kinase n=2 Tax=Actinomycetes TaxID=1760 RepID=UPI0028982DC8|nr:protein kinase [Mobilicoccus sp.]
MTTQPVEPGAVERLGDYRLHGVLGEGGMGVVHLGVDPSGRAVAVKVLREHVAHDRTARARLAREVATLRRVEHHAVAPFLGADVEGTRPYIVTRYVPGEPLDAWVREHGPLQGRALRDVGLTLLDALRAIHDADVVHRDLKPGNVLMADGSPVVIDFGIAHVADESRLTSTGLVMGTPGYLAPELLDGHDATPATDLWGLAATLAFAATGRAPFGGGRTEAVHDRVRRGAADLTGLEGWVAQLVNAGLDPDPRRRPTLETARRVLENPSLAATVLPPLPVPSAASAATTTLAQDHAPGGATPSARRPDDSASDRGSSAAMADTAATQAVPGPAAREESTPTQRFEQLVGRAFPRRHRGDADASASSSGVPAGAASQAPATVSHPVVSTRLMPTVPPRHDPAPPAPPAPSSPYAAFRASPAGTGGATAYPPPRHVTTRPDHRPGHARPGYGHPGDGRGNGQDRPGPAYPAANPGVPGGGWSPTAPPRPVSSRTGTLLAVGLFLVALIAYRPGLGILVALGWSGLARLTDRLFTTVLLRRASRGPRDTDVAVAALATPWHLIGAMFSALVAGVLPLLVGAGLVFGLRAVAGNVDGLPLSLSPALMLGAAGGLIVAWWGPGGTTVRLGSRVLVRTVAPGHTGAIVLSVAAGVSAAVLALLTQSSGWELSWWPLDGLLDGLRGLVPALTRWIGV